MGDAPTLLRAARRRVDDAQLAKRHEDDPRRCVEDGLGGSRSALKTKRYQPFSNSEFKEWTGACEGTLPGVPTQLLTVEIEEGEGTVVSSPSGIECSGAAPKSCETESIEAGTVTLTASPAPGYVFKSWRKCDHKEGEFGVNGRQCTIGLNEAKEVGAKFVKTYQLTLHNGGGGKVSSKPGGALCLPGCTEATASFKEGTAVEVLPKPNKHFHLASWGGDCSGSGACVVPMSEDREVSASFAEDQNYALTLTKSGPGQGIVKSHPAGIVCSYTCGLAEASFYANEAVTLEVPAVGKGSAFKGWSGGGCSGTGSCVVTMTGAESVIAEFE